jgi:hypothetical protein
MLRIATAMTGRRRWLAGLATLTLAMAASVSTAGLSTASADTGQSPGRTAGAAAPVTGSYGDPNPWNDPNLVSMFDGTTLAGWTASKPGAFVVQDGTVHSTGAGRGWLYYSRNQVGSFRWVFNVRQVKGNHAPTVLIWGTVKPIRDALSAIQFQPPNGGHWDYRPGHNDSGGKRFKRYPHPKWDVHQWSQCELLADQKSGVARMACCPLAAGAATCTAVEVLRFTDSSAGRVGPIAIQIHNGGIQDEYRNLFVESPVKKPGEFITTVPAP